MALTAVDDTQLRDLIGQGKPVVVDFTADWCRPCHAIAPELETLSERVDSSTFVKLDIDAHPELSVKLGIRSVPTVVHFSASGEEVARSVGAARAEELARRLLLEL